MTLIEQKNNLGKTDTVYSLGKRFHKIQKKEFEKKSSVY